MTDHTIPRYAIEREIGSGNIAAVYLALDRLTQRSVALKMIKSTTISSEMRLTLANEFRTMASLRHPYIVSVFDYGFTSQQIPYFTMNYLPNAQTFVQAGRAQSSDIQIQLIGQFLEALAYLHRRNFLHHDLKPGNILVDHNGVKMVDFGLSRLISLTQAGQSRGTLAYMAPEVLRNQPMTPKSELFSLGVLVYEMLSDHYPFPLSPAIAMVNGILNTELDFSQFGLPDPVANILQRLVMKNPDHRYETAQSAINDLYIELDIRQPDDAVVIRESYLQAATFVGRQREVNQLQIALSQTQRGHSQVWLVGGESGVGKSRLADEIRTHALVQGFEVLKGQAVQGGGLPFQSWREPVRHLLLARPINDLQAGIFKEIVPDIEQILGRPVTSLPPLDGSAHQERLIYNIIDLLSHQRNPTLLLLEDLQWATKDLEVIKQVVKVLDQLPNLMVLGTYRHDERPDLPQQLSDVHTLVIDRLDDGEVNELSRSMLGDQGSDPQLVSTLIEETEGNTFFIIEVMRAWAEESGHLRQIGIHPVSTNILTRGMQVLLQRRVQQVQYDDQKLLKHAAIVGRQLDLRILEALTHQNVYSWLQRVSGAYILTISDGQWQFAHDKLREAILRELTEEERHTLRRDIAEAIEQVYPDNRDYYPILLELWHQVGNIDKEIYYLLPVSEHMIQFTVSHEEARRLLERTLHELSDMDARQISLWNWQSLSHIHQGNYDKSLSLAQKALKLAEDVGDQQGVADSLLNLGYVAYQTGDLQTSEYLQTSLALKQILEDRQGIATILSFLAIITMDGGRYADAVDYNQQSLAIYQDTGDLRGTSNCSFQLGIIAYLQGNIEQATRYFQQSLTICQDIGALRGIAKNLNMLGMSAARRGEFEQAWDYVAQSQSVVQDIEGVSEIGYAIGILGIIETQQGNHEEACSYLEQSLSIFQANGNPHGIINSSLLLGFAYLNLDIEQAHHAFTKALMENRTLRFIPLMLQTLLGFAWIQLRQGDGHQAAELAGLVQSYPAHDIEVELYLSNCLTELEQALDPVDLQVALNRGKELDLETVVNDILTYET